MDQVVLLGTKGGPAVRKGSAMPTASLLQMAGQNIVIDCGIGVTRSLVEAGVTLLDFHTIFITHLHSDHVLELGPLLYTAWTTGLKHPVTIYGPVGTDEYWEGFLSSMSYDQSIRIEDEGRTPIRNLVTVKTFGEGHVADLGDISVEALRVDHPPVTECYGLKFEADGKRVVFSSDTCFFPPLIEFARDADLLIHEAMLTDGIEALVAKTNGGDRLRNHLYASHTPAADVGRVAKEAGVKALALHHLVPCDDPDFTAEHWTAEVAKHWAGPTLIGEDGMQIPF